MTNDYYIKRVCLIHDELIKQGKTSCPFRAACKREGKKYCSYAKKLKGGKIKGGK